MFFPVWSTWVGSGRIETRVSQYPLSLALPPSLPGRTQVAPRTSERYNLSSKSWDDFEGEITNLSLITLSFVLHEVVMKCSTCTHNFSVWHINWPQPLNVHTAATKRKCILDLIVQDMLSHEISSSWRGLHNNQEKLWMTHTYKAASAQLYPQDVCSEWLTLACSTESLLDSNLAHDRAATKYLGIFTFLFIYELRVSSSRKCDSLPRPVDVLM